MLCKKKENYWLIKLSQGEEIILSLRMIAKEHKIKGGFFFGLGSVKDPELGYFDLNLKDYTHQRFRGDYEVTSLVGNISYKNKDPIVHAHVNLSGKNFLSFGGHLFSGQTNATMEILLLPLEEKITRKFNETLNLSLLDF